MDKDYCIENDLPRQRELAEIERETLFTESQALLHLEKAYQVLEALNLPRSIKNEMLHRLHSVQEAVANYCNLDPFERSCLLEQAWNELGLNYE